MLTDLYPVALDCGILPDEFWDSSYSEILDRIESHNRIEERKKKESIAANYELAALVGLHVAKIFDEDKQVSIPMMWDMYPALFAGERAEYEEKQKKALMAQYKAQMIDYSLRHNNHNKSK